MVAFARILTILVAGMTVLTIVATAYNTLYLHNYETWYSEEEGE